MLKFSLLILSTTKPLFIIKYVPVQTIFRFRNCCSNQKICKRLLSLSSSSFHYEKLTSHFEQRKNLENWIEYCRYSGVSIPENLKEDDMNHLLLLDHNQRLKYIKRLSTYKTNKRKLQDQKLKLREMNEIQKKERQKLQPSHIKYGLWETTIFTNVVRRQIKDLHNHRMASAMLHNQPLIIDLDFQSYMDEQECKSLAVELLLSINHNRQNINPFNLTLCNADFNSETMIALKKRMSNIETLPMNIFTKHYLDLYPKEQLVYLTPDAREEVKSLDHQAVYIIGGIVNRHVENPLSFAKAKREGIRKQKLPLDKHLVFKRSKSLPVFNMVALLLDLQNTGDWKTAVKNVPAYFYRTAAEQQVELPENHRSGSVEFS